MAFSPPVVSPNRSDALDAVHSEDGSVYAGEWVGTVRPVFPCSRLGGVMSGSGLVSWCSALVSKVGAVDTIAE